MRKWHVYRKRHVLLTVFQNKSEKRYFKCITPKFIRSRRNVCKRSKSLLTSLCRKMERGVALVVRLVYVDSGQLEEQLQKVCQVGRADVRNGRLWGEKVIEEKKKVSINSGKYSVHQNCDTCGSSPRWISDSSAVWRGHEEDVSFFLFRPGGQKVNPADANIWMMTGWHLAVELA